MEIFKLLSQNFCTSLRDLQHVHPHRSPACSGRRPGSPRDGDARLLDARRRDGEDDSAPDTHGGRGCHDALPRRRLVARDTGKYLFLNSIIAISKMASFVFC